MRKITILLFGLLWTLPCQPNTLSSLKAVRHVSEANIDEVTDLLFSSADEIKRRWDEELVREAGRVVDMSMNYDSRSYITISEPFEVVLLGGRKREFVDIIMDTLSEVNRPTFRRCVETLLMVNKNGNG